jgi:glycosyltransferase involved in cell wall biosynthesis
MWKETGPYTVLEAQWVGTPVIGSNRGGIPERLEGDASSVLFDAPDIDDLARAIRSFLGRREATATKEGRARPFREKYMRGFEAALDRLLEVVRRQPSS